MEPNPLQPLSLPPIIINLLGMQESKQIAVALTIKLTTRPLDEGVN